MSIRALWIISPKGNEKVLYSRKFPTVEQRARRFGPAFYVPIPQEEEFAKCLLHRLELSDTVEFDDWRDSCQMTSQVPVLEVKTPGGGTLWPLVVIEHFGLFCCCLGLEKERSSSIPLYKVPSISIGFAVLTNIISFLGNKAAKLHENSGLAMELDHYLRQHLPFGCLAIQDQSQPVQVARPKQSLTLETTEFLRCMQHAKIVETVLEVTGTVALSAELEEEHAVRLSISPELNLAIGPSVRLVHHNPPESVVEVALPPTQGVVTTVAQYSAHHSTDLLPPIIGAFQLLDKGENTVELFLKLNLSRGVKNSFDSLDVFIPFYNRGKVCGQELSSSVGMVLVHEDRTSLTWKIGQFPRNMEATLWGGVVFSPEPAGGLAPLEPFLSSLNTFAQVLFTKSGTPLSNCKIQLETSSLPRSVKVLTGSRSVATEYRIWNDNGDIPFVPRTGEI